MNFDPYDILEEETLKVKPILRYHFLDLLKQVNRRICKNSRVHNPWRINVTIKIFGTVFLRWYRAVKDYKIKEYRDITLKKTKNETKSIEIKFTHVGPFKFHLRNAIGIKDKKAFQEEFMTRRWSDGSVGEVVVTEEDPATMFFNLKTGALSISLKYAVKNQHGVLMF